MPRASLLMFGSLVLILQGCFGTNGVTPREEQPGEEQSRKEPQPAVSQAAEPSMDGMVWSEAVGDYLGEPENTMSGGGPAPLLAGGAGEIFHTVVRGDSLSSIARRYSVSTSRLQAANGIADPNRLRIGARLLIPQDQQPTAYLASSAGVAGQPPGGAPDTVHIVVGGESLSTIAKRYSVSVRQLQADNNIANPHALQIGDRLVIPGQGRSVSASSTAPTNGFIWPLVNPVIRDEFGRLGADYHSGLDLGAPKNTPIRASAAGVVFFSGRKPRYGRVVILQHGDNIQTVYAHNRENLVQRGQRVEQGQFIATVGRSDNAQGHYLHFEMIVGEQSVNPRNYLPDNTVLKAVASMNWASLQ